MALLSFFVVQMNVAAESSNGQSRGVGVSLRIGTSTLPLYSESHALVIGASRYSAGWPKLPGVPSDIDAVVEALRALGFATTVITDPTRVRMDSALRRFMGGPGQQANARLLVYYAGHGHTMTTADGRQLGYVVPVDAPMPSRDLPGFIERAVSMAEIENVATQMQAKHVLFVFDSCFSGTLLARRGNSIPEYISEKTARPVREFITAGAADQSVPDHSVFRREFVEALTGAGDANRDGYVTGTELHAYLDEKVTTASRRAQTPLFGKIHDGVLDKGDFVFEVKQSGAAAEPSAFDSAALDNEFWRSVVNSGDAAQFRAYLNRFPKGIYAELANAKIAQLGRQGSAAGVAPQTVSTEALFSPESFGGLRRGATFDDAVRLWGPPSASNLAEYEVTNAEPYANWGTYGRGIYVELCRCRTAKCDASRHRISAVQVAASALDDLSQVGVQDGREGYWLEHFTLPERPASASFSDGLDEAYLWWKTAVQDIYTSYPRSSSWTVNRTEVGISLQGAAVEIRSKKSPALLSLTAQTITFQWGCDGEVPDTE